MSRKKTTEEFIADARKVHGDTYDYSKVSYLSAKSKVCIICRDHGEFWQSPNNHLFGRGCPICAGNQRLSSNEFVAKAKSVHGEKYDYSKVSYSSAQEKVCIICPEHGEFWQSPNNHLNGQGCPKCGGSFPLTKDDFVRISLDIHGDNYDYSKVNYVNNRRKICIVCPKHGDFWQTPGSHLSGCGCPKCANNSRSIKKRLPKEDFIDRANLLYENKYDYSRVDYRNKDTKVCIICPEHGEFWQLPGHHLRGHQCPTCSGVHRLTTDEFIHAARKIHGDRYDYSNVKYINAFTPVLIGCSIHGQFRQIPRRHLQGRGCPLCNSSHLEDLISNLLTENGIVYEREKMFPWLRDKAPLKLDYYLPDYSVAIECQGIQHFEPIDYFGGYDSYVETIARDAVKKELCLSHGVRVLYFSNLEIQYPYTVYENTKDLLKSIQR